MKDHKDERFTAWFIRNDWRINLDSIVRVVNDELKSKSKSTSRKKESKFDGNSESIRKRVEYKTSDRSIIVCKWLTFPCIISRIVSVTDGSSGNLILFDSMSTSGSASILSVVDTLISFNLSIVKLTSLALASLLSFTFSLLTFFDAFLLFVLCVCVWKSLE